MGTNMKTLNLNKLTILLGLFLVSAFFTTAANASCRYTDAGLLDVVSGDTDAPVYETSRSARGDQCSDTPDEYEITFYKLGLCTATTIANDLSRSRNYTRLTFVGRTIPMFTIYSSRNFEDNYRSRLYVRLCTCVNQVVSRYCARLQLYWWVGETICLEQVQ